MYELFESHIGPILDEHNAKTLLEIGVLRGDTTLKLLEWCSANGASLVSLDPVAWKGDLPEEIKKPMPGYEYKRGQADFDNWVVEPKALEEVYRQGLDKNWTCLKARSLDYLASPEFDGFDAYIIDGDHNYYTVSKELEMIHGHYKPDDVVMFNDVVGAYSRKDLYYDPQFIPEDYIGGRKQGVMTAIDDFLDSLSEKRLWRRRNCPYQFRIVTKKYYGLGVMTRTK